MQSLQKLRVAGYFRVSSEDQLDNWSLDAQERAFTEFCNSKGWEPVAKYREEGKSAWTDKLAKRPKFRELLDDASGNNFDVIVVHSLDRWARNLSVTLDSFRSLSQSGVTFVSIQEQIDYTTPEGRLFLVMLGGFAQYFSDALARHTTKGLKERAMRGLFNGDPPFGYDRCTESCKDAAGHGGCHPVEAQAKAVEDLFTRYAGGGWSLSKLAGWLNDQGFRTRNRKTIKLTDGITLDGPQPFTAYSVRSLLHNPFYLGRVRYREESFPGRHQGIIKQGLFDQVQMDLLKAKSNNHTISSGKRHYLLQGLSRCVHCGYPMWADSRGRNHTAYYRERPGLSGSKCSYGAWSVPASIADQQIEVVFSELKLQDNWKDRVIDRISSQSQREAINQERESLDGKLGRLNELYVEGNITKEEYQTRQRAIKERLDVLVIPEVDAATIAGSLMENMPALWAQADIRQRNRMLSSMLEAVLLDPASRSVVGLLPKPAFREIILNVQPGNGVVIFDPAENRQKKAAGTSILEDLPRITMLGYGGDGGGPDSSSPQLRKWPRDVEVTPGATFKEDTLQLTLTSSLLQRGALGCTTPRVPTNRAASRGRTARPN